MSASFPVSMRLEGLEVLVVGGGPVAERRTRDLLAAEGQVTLIAPTITAGLRDLHARETIMWHPRVYKAGDLDGFWLVQIATNSPTVNDKISADAYAARVFSFKGGDSAAATLWRPAITEIDGSTVAVSGGGNPLRAKTLRDRLAELIEHDARPVSDER